MVLMLYVQLINRTAAMMGQACVSLTPPTAYPAHSAYPTHSLYSCTCSYSVIHSETCQQKLEKILMSHACISFTSCPWVHDSIPYHYCTISIVVVMPFITRTYGHSPLPAWIANCTLESVPVCDLHWCCGLSHAVCPVSCSSPYPPRYCYYTEGRGWHVRLLYIIRNDVTDFASTALESHMRDGVYDAICNHNRHPGKRQ